MKCDVTRLLQLPMSCICSVEGNTIKSVNDHLQVPQAAQWLQQYYSGPTETPLPVPAEDRETAKPAPAKVLSAMLAVLLWRLQLHETGKQQLYREAADVLSAVNLAIHAAQASIVVCGCAQTLSSLPFQNVID